MKNTTQQNFSFVVTFANVKGYATIINTFKRPDLNLCNLAIAVSKVSVKP